MQTQRGVFRFRPVTGYTQSQRHTVVFETPIAQAEVFLKGLNAGFSCGDRNFGRIETDVSIVRIQGGAVEVQGTLLLRDASGVIDDAYDGWIEYVVLAS